MTAHISKLKKAQKAFTLVELLVVIAVLGVLAASVLIAINPLEQLARGRDAGRIEAITDLGKGIQNNYTNNSGTYLTASSTWVTSLVSAGDVKISPVNPAGSTCTTNASNGYCYNTGTLNGATEAIVWAKAESKSQASKCGATSTTGWIVWSSADGKTGIYCNNTEPSAPSATILGNLK